MSPLPPGDGDEEPLDDLLRPLDEGSGPARRLSRKRSSALVQAALDAALQPVAPAPPSRRRKRPPVWLMAGAALVFTGAAAAAVWRFSASRPATPVVLTPHVPEPTRIATLEPVSLPSPPAPFVIEHPRPARPVPATREQARPEDLLRQANALRSEGKWTEAEGLYLRVIRAQPSSLAAYVARVASGALRLEHLGDARGALRQFQDAQRSQPGGMLDPEARHGEAEAYRALGDTAAEARALDAFIALHPDSPLGATARSRLRELSPR
ncbi:tetratricopeptide repeat protein [Corallococcus llansteffanensis]|uniref:Tetratricopeptide repeat protein n=1 Tax=Corallococcus llansteffanensis TaxID=2316731 RepID=A0A3A8Q7P0_9BACT|nr:tetratricopeptide repeat protein [Corallococcus llansteffanensis]RKH63541.1 tetratricopeptide repeat protein [Corallococcus llansteffanensis]